MLHEDESFALLELCHKTDQRVNLVRVLHVVWQGRHRQFSPGFVNICCDSRGQTFVLRVSYSYGRLGPSAKASPGAAWSPRKPGVFSVYGPNHIGEFVNLFAFDIVICTSKQKPHGIRSRGFAETHQEP